MIPAAYKTALVTGATSGIGRATANRLAALGMMVVLLAESEDAIASCTTEICTSGHQAVGVTCDLSDPAAVAKVLPDLDALGITVDVLVNNAGVGLQADISQATDSDWRRLFQVNLFASATLSRDAVQRMASRGYGQIVNISSCAARRGLPGMGVYAASKGGMHILSQSLRNETFKSGIHVTEILPMSVKTAFFDSAKNRKSHVYEPGGFMITPERVAELVVRSLHHPAPEVYTSTLARLVLGIDSAQPKILDWFIRRRMR